MKEVIIQRISKDIKIALEEIDDCNDDILVNNNTNKEKLLEIASLKQRIDQLLAIRSYMENYNVT